MVGDFKKLFKKTWFKLVLILGLSFFLRLIVINQSLWLDEAISWETVSKFSFSEILIKFSPKDFNPPLYYLVLKLWFGIFPSPEFFLRFPSVLFGVLTVFFVFLLYNTLYKKEHEALAASLLFSLSGLHIYYSQEARMYSLAALGTAGCYYFFAKILSFGKKNKNRYKNKDQAESKIKAKSVLKNLFSFNGLGYVFFGLMALYSHYLTLFLFVSQALYVFFFKKDKVKDFLVFLFFVFLFFLPWLPTFFAQLKIGESFSSSNLAWSSLGAFSLKNVLLLPIKFIIGRTSFQNDLLYGVVSFVLLLLFGFVLTRVAKASKKNCFFWFWFLIPIFLGVLISFFIPLFSYFRFLFCLPPFYILLTRGIFQFKKRNVFLFLVLGINLFFSFYYLFNSSFHRENWKEAVARLHELNVDSKVLIIENVSAPFKYYDRGESELVYFHKKELVSNLDEVYLIPYAQPIFYPQDGVRKFLKAKGFYLVYEEHFRGVTLEKWQKLLAIDYNKAGL
jgi:mannosyltransferase